MLSEDEFVSTETPVKEMLDVGSLFRGTATITLVAEIVSAIMLLGSASAYVIRDYVSVIEPDVALFLVLVGAS